MKILLFVVGSFVVLFGYTNCAPFEVAVKGSSVFSSRTTSQCDEVLLTTYRTSVQPFFRSSATCIGCHIEGGTGLGAFSSADALTSYTAFNAAGFSKVQYMATNPQHKPPYTGAQNQPSMDRIGQLWNTAEVEHLSCVSKSENGGVDESILTAPKSANAIYNTNNATQTLTWNLDVASDLDDTVKRSLPARVSIDVKVLNSIVDGRPQAKGYIFSNPQMALKTTGQQIVVEGLFFQINGRPITSQTTFTNLSRVVSSQQAIPLMVASANTLIAPVGSSDTFQLYFRRMVPTEATGESSPPLTPIFSLADQTTGASDFVKSSTVSTFILRDSGIFRWCLSESPVKPASTEAPCVNTMTNSMLVNGWHTRRPTEFQLSPGNGTKRVYLWVANDSLLISENAAQFSVTVDTDAPAAPQITSITVGNTQVANMTVSHPNENDVAGWCVSEANIVKTRPNIALNDACWRWTDLNAKPTTVGFKGNGQRNVWVYVRDRAGNISAPSNMLTRTNTLSEVTFSQLTGAQGLPTSVFTNRCAACHSSSANPGFSKLQLFNYESALDVADNGQLVSRINNVISPMPNVSGGLMPQVERDLIRLWTMPEEGTRPIQ